jgi:transketolase
MSHISEALIQSLEQKAQSLRVTSLELVFRRQAGHIGGALSAADIVAALFFHTLRIDPTRPDAPDRDRFILSKGHASAVLYAALAARGFLRQEDLEEWGSLECQLQGHPDRLKTPGVDMTSGILGHGIAIGAGLALAARLNGLAYRTYVLLGDGECQGGIVWEGAMAAAKYRLSNLTAIIDANNVQLDGPVQDIMPLEPMAAKWKSFNWSVLEIDGHNVRSVLEAFELAAGIKAGPTVIIAHTTKGKGVSFMENKALWHGAVPDREQYNRAMAELRTGI